MVRPVIEKITKWSWVEGLCVKLVDKKKSEWGFMDTLELGWWELVDSVL